MTNIMMMKSNIASAARRTILRSAVVHANRPAVVYFSSNNHKLQKLPIDYIEEARKKMDAAEASHQTTRTVHNGFARRKLQKLPIDYINEARDKLNMPTRSFSTAAYDRAAEEEEEMPPPKFTTYGTAAGKKMHKLAIDYLNDAREKRLSQESRGNIGCKTPVRNFSTFTCGLNELDMNEEETTASQNPEVTNYGSAAGKKMHKLAIDYLNDAREKRLAEESKNFAAGETSQDSK